MKAFVISLSKIDSSMATATVVLDKLLEYGFDAELFEGTYGNDAVKLFKKERRRPAKYGIKTIKKDVVNRRTGVVTQKIERLPWGADDAGKALGRPGVLGCFYSHYTLWKKCIELDEPIFIFEDDVIFIREYYPIEWEEILMVCTGKSSYQHPYYAQFYDDPTDEPKAVPMRNTSMPGAVGYGITPKAAKKLVNAYKKEFMPADTAMNVFVVKLECHNHLMGRAAIEEDGKVSLTTSKHWNTL